MLYEILWMHYILWVGIFLGLGLLGVIVATSISKKSSRMGAFIFSLCVLIAGAYFIYQWEAEKAKIRTLADQIEKSFQHYQKNIKPANRP